MILYITFYILFYIYINRDKHFISHYLVISFSSLQGNNLWNRVCVVLLSLSLGRSTSTNAAAASVPAVFMVTLQERVLEQIAVAAGAGTAPAAVAAPQLLARLEELSVLVHPWVAIASGTAVTAAAVATAVLDVDCDATGWMMEPCRCSS